MVLSGKIARFTTCRNKPMGGCRRTFRIWSFAMFKNFNPSFLGLSGHQSEVIELALTYGFSGMDLNIADFATRVRLKGLPYARRLIDSARIRVGTFQLPIDWDTTDETFHKDLTKLQEYADAAAAIGCTRCCATLSPAGDNRPYHENFAPVPWGGQNASASLHTREPRGPGLPASPTLWRSWQPAGRCSENST